MELEEFNRLKEGQFKRCSNTLSKKEEEYANTWVTGDRLNQMKTSGRLQGCSPVKAHVGEMAKHSIKIYDYAQMYEKGANIPQKKWDEVITDHINYLILLNALLKES